MVYKEREYVFLPLKKKKVKLTIKYAVFLTQVE